MAKQKVQDDIQLNLQAQKVIVHETVRVNINVQAQVDPSQSESEFRAELQSTLHRFIDADWKVQSVNRNKSGKFENVFVSATARVPEKENHHLHERADAVSRIGFELSSSNVDYALSFDDIQAINAELRNTLLKMALAECTAINLAFKEAGHKPVKYRVSSTRFDQGNNHQINNNVRTSAYMATMATGTASPLIAHSAQTKGSVMRAMDETQFEDASDAGNAPADLNVSTRFSMTGQFILRALIDA